LEEEIETPAVANDYDECQPIANDGDNKSNFDRAWIADWKIFPYNGGTEVLEWVGKFRDYISLLDAINEEHKLKILRFYLEGMARNLLDEKRPSTLEEAINILINYFQNYAAKQKARNELNGCKQTMGEKVFDFADRLNKCLSNYMNGKDGEIFESQLLERFVDGLNKKLYFEVARKMPKTFEEAYESAQLEEFFMEKYKLVKAVPNSTHSAQMGRKIRICYFCKKPGHFINNCPEERKAANYPRNNFPRMYRKYSSNDYNRCKNWRDRDYLKQNSRCKYDNGFNNWRSPSCKDEAENWREIPSLKPDSKGCMFEDASGKVPARKADQCDRMFEDANWRKMPAPKSDQLGWTCDQFGRTFKDFRGDGMQ
jgi:hypothetical protein